MKIKMALAAAGLAVAVSGTANAQMQGLYLSAGAGANWLTDGQVELDGTGHTTFKSGFIGQFAVGYGFGMGIRAEFETSYRHNLLERNVYPGCCTYTGKGSVGQLGLMVNGAYDIDFGSPFIPFVGAGAGAVRVRFDELGNKEPDFFIDDSDWTWGVQGFAGVNARVAPGVLVGVKYNFLHIGKSDDLRIPGFCGSCGSFDPNNHSVLATLTLAIGAPPALPPAPAPAAAPAVQRNFLVFFDFDKSDITAEADRVIVQAANNAKSAQVTRLTLTGHTDRSGPVAYNQRLSERRADAVKARLVREGIPAASIVTIGRGESQPLVPTADGVREPQNRRVEIVL